MVKYNSDPRLVTGNHESAIIYLLDTDEQGFDDLNEAIIFLSECTLPITTIEELVPELKACKKFKYVLPNKNIRPKHQLQSSMDEVVEFDW